MSKILKNSHLVAKSNFGDVVDDTWKIIVYGRHPFTLFLLVKIFQISVKVYVLFFVGFIFSDIVGKMV